MGLFFNYDKPGKGIDKNAPKKKGAALFFELVWRKLKILTLSNMLYFLVSLPVIAVYFLLLDLLIGNVFETTDVQIHMHIILILTFILTILWGSGPASCGYTYLMRCFAREEHAWITSDFFERIRKNFKYGIVILLCDIAMLFLGITSMRFYSAMYASGKSYALILMALVFMVMVMYTFMHYYMYEFAVTFEIGIITMFKNSMIMAAAALPMNVLMTVIVFAGTYLIASLFTIPAVIIIMFVFWISFLRFPIDFYVARRIKRELIDPNQKESD